MVVQVAVVIPTRNEIDVPTKTVYSKLNAMQDTDGVLWMTESGEAAYRLQVANTLVSSSPTAVPVRVMNVSDHPVT